MQSRATACKITAKRHLPSSTCGLWSPLADGHGVVWCPVAAVRRLYPATTPDILPEIREWSIVAQDGAQAHRAAFHPPLRRTDRYPAYLNTRN